MACEALRLYLDAQIRGKVADLTDLASTNIRTAGDDEAYHSNLSDAIQLLRRREDLGKLFIQIEDSLRELGIQDPDPKVVFSLMAVSENGSDVSAPAETDPVSIDGESPRQPIVYRKTTNLIQMAESKNKRLTEPTAGQVEFLFKAFEENDRGNDWRYSGKGWVYEIGRILAKDEIEEIEGRNLDADETKKKITRVLNYFDHERQTIAVKLVVSEKKQRWQWPKKFRAAIEELEAKNPFFNKLSIEEKVAVLYRELPFSRVQKLRAGSSPVDAYGNGIVEDPEKRQLTEKGVFGLLEQALIAECVVSSKQSKITELGIKFSTAQWALFEGFKNVDDLGLVKQETVDGLVRKLRYFFANKKEVLEQSSEDIRAQQMLLVLSSANPEFVSYLEQKLYQLKGFTKNR